MEAQLKKLLAGIAATSAFALFASVAQADCVGNHNVTASAPASQKGVAMSTYDGAVTAPSPEEIKPAATAATDCADGEKECTTPTTE